MTVEEPILSMYEWFMPGPGRLGAGASGIIGLLGVSLFLMFFGFLVFAGHEGPGAGLARLGRTLGEGLRDLGDFSFRRLWAMTRLAFQEALRKKVLVAFAIFALVMLFASWYLDVKTDQPAQLYMAVVLGWTNLLVLILALFLSTFSLPNDMKTRTIYTVVTKPVRIIELVLGRMLGFVLIGTLILLVMCVLSYFFVWRGLSHRHEVEAASLVQDTTIVDDKGNYGMSGRTTEEDYHRHTVFIEPDGRGYTDTQKGHRHLVTRTGEGENARYVVGPPIGQMQARLWQDGTLRFLDRSGRPTDKGINVGNEWTYRSYIEGGTLAAAIWTFDNVTARRFPASKKEFERGIPVELTLRVFRTYKGDIEKGILGSLEIVEYLTPEEIDQGKQPLVSEPVNFYAQEFTADRKYIPRELRARRGGGPLQDVDLFDDLAHDGKLQIRIRCLEKAQYYGAAKSDVYLWTGDNYFWMNFAKGYLGIWFQMVIVIAFGVMFSTFLSGPVAMLATIMAYATGYFSQFVRQVTTGEAEGGGPLESFIRIVEQRNLVTELDEGVGTTVVYGFDNIMLVIMWMFSFVLPDYSKFQTSSFVASGYNIPTELMLQHFITALVFFLALGIVGYFIFKSREVAK
jgi:ABC-type transport system involved in multi-copper enzyme maturation permease subunit